MTSLRRLALGGIAALCLLAGGLHFGGADEIVAFVVAGFALAGLAWVISFTTEEVGAHFGPAVTAQHIANNTLVTVRYTCGHVAG